MATIDTINTVKTAKKITEQEKLKRFVDLYVHLDKTIKGLENKKKEIRKHFEGKYGFIEGNTHAIKITKESYKFFNKKKLEEETGKEFVEHFTEVRERAKIIIVK